MIAPQLIMVFTLALMLTGKAPIYLTALVGATAAALAAGFPLTGAPVDGVPTINSLLQGGMHGVILDMLGVLMFIGIMEHAGYLNVIIVKLMRLGQKIGGGPGVCTAGGIVAGLIGSMTGFAQPVVSGVIAGPAAVELGVDKNKVAGTLAHTGTLGNFSGFTHPTQVAVIATAGISFGLINVVGLIVGFALFGASFWRMRRTLKKEGGNVLEGAASLGSDLLNQSANIPFGKAFFPFAVLVVCFVNGFPIFLVGVLCSIIVVLMTSRNFINGEKKMIEGISRITVPLLATIAFLYMSSVITQIGLVDVIADALGGYLAIAPIIIMLLVSSLTGLLTQSNMASAAIVVPFLTIVLATTDAHPVTAAIAAAGGPAVMQYYLTGGPVAALATVIPLIPGSDLKLANRFQRPSIIFCWLVLLAIIIILQIVM